MLIFWTLFGAFIILLIVLATAYGAFLWIRRSRYTRERFAFAALAAVAALSGMLILAISKNTMPWDVVALLLNYLLGAQIPLNKPTTTDYGFLLAVYAIAIYSIIQLHKHWGGLKSVDQYRREQRSEPSGLLAEGVYEVRRLAGGRDEPQLYSPPDPRDFLAQLEPIKDSLAWKDQARELLRLSSASYAFDAENGWHDLAHIWVGKNLDTDELAILHPASELPTSQQVNEIVRNATAIGSLKGCPVGAIIIAIHGRETIEDKPEHPQVQIVTEAELLDGLVTWTDYVNEIRKRVTVNHLSDSELTLGDVYVPPRCNIEGAGGSPLDVQTLLSDWASERSQRHIALLGGYGQGKSTTALLFTHNALLKKDLGLRIPLLIELRGTSPRNLTPLQLLGAWSAQYNINPQSLLRLHIAGRLILIFEGFDEMALVGDTEMRLKHFRTLWQFSYPEAKIIITGRPNFFLDENEMKAALGIYKPTAGRAYCEALRLLPFDKEQIATSLRAQKESVRLQICALVIKNARFLELVSRPSLLHIVSVLWEREQLSTKVDRLDSAYIMDLFVRHSYRRQGRKEADSPEFMALTSSEREYFMQGIAAYMATERMPNQISGSQLSQLVEGLIRAMPDSLSVEDSAMLGEIRAPLKQRLEGSEYGIEHVKTDVRACGLLVDDPAAPGTFRFGHKSFMEFLFAAVLSDRITADRDRSRAILKATGASINDLDHLPVSVEFLAEMLSANDVVPEASSRPTDSLLSQQRQAAERLASAVWVGGSGVRSFNRLLVFLDCLGRSTTPLLPTWMRSMPRPWGLMMLMLVLMVPFVVISLERVTSQTKASTSPLLIVSYVGLIASFTLTMFHRSQFRRLRLWNQLCRQMGIADEVMHKVVGTWRLPWARRQIFDYYLHARTYRSQLNGTVPET